MKQQRDFTDPLERAIFSNFVQKYCLPHSWGFILLIFQFSKDKETEAFYVFSVPEEEAIEVLKKRIERFENNEEYQIEMQFENLLPHDLRDQNKFLEVSALIEEKVPENHGHIFMIFDKENPSISNYVANAERSSAIQFMKETIFRMKNDENLQDLFLYTSP